MKKYLLIVFVLCLSFGLSVEAQICPDSGVISSCNDAGCIPGTNPAQCIDDQAPPPGGGGSDDPVPDDGCPDDFSSEPCPGAADQNVRFELENPFKIGDSLYDLLVLIINDILLPIGGVLAVIAFIYAGFKYVTARGNSTKISEAHQILYYTIIGTVLLLGAWVFANIIKNTIEQLWP